jgi:hypothetical protein
MLMLAAIALLTSVPAAVPNRVVFIPTLNAPQLLKQCSRPTPPAGTSWFTPTPAQVDALERAVVARNPRFGPLPTLRRMWRVEIVGIVRGGRRFVYGGFAPSNQPPTPAGVPTIICDGGDLFFGAEIDASNGRLTHFASNGR